MKKCIGIISYFPDGELGDVRRKSCFDLITTLDSYYRVDIVIVAQNWNDEDVNRLTNFKNQKITVYRYDCLGITCARETLRQKIISLNYIGAIFVDDDIELTNDKQSISRYISTINFYENLLVVYDNYLLNLCYIPVHILKNEPFDVSIDAKSGTGYEDWIYISILNKKYKHIQLSNTFKMILKSRHEMCVENNSTWRDGTEKDQTEISKSKIIEGTVSYVR